MIRKSGRQHLLELVVELDPVSMSGREAAKAVQDFSRIQCLAATAKALCARQVALTSDFDYDGAHDTTGWLANSTGESHGSAKAELGFAAALERLPLVKDALISGELSVAQAVEIARGASLDPSAEHELIETAKQGSMRGLRSHTEKVRASSMSKEDVHARHERIKRSRHLRTYLGTDGAFCGRFSLAPEDGAALMAGIGSLADQAFDQARRNGVREPREAYLADALVEAVSGTQDPPAARPSYQVVVRIDYDALVRGEVARGEECSIDGAGHVPVAVVQSLLDTSSVRLVVTKGIDVRAIYSTRRGIGIALRTALEFRDRCCVVPGCGSTFRLEIDHIQEVACEGPTTLSNLCRLCRFHHAQKSKHTYTIRGAPGAWAWVRLPEPSASTETATQDSPDAVASSSGTPGASGPHLEEASLAS